MMMAVPAGHINGTQPAGSKAGTSCQRPTGTIIVGFKSFLTNSRFETVNADQDSSPTFQSLASN